MQIVDSQDIPITPITTTSFTLEAAETTFFTETTPTTNIKKNVLKVKFPRKISGKIGNIFDKDIPLVRNSDFNFFRKSKKDNKRKILLLFASANLSKLNVKHIHHILQIYCARKITALFLLPDEKGDLIPDSCVRVSIKVLATDCLASVISLLPKISQLTLYSDQVNLLKQSKIILPVL